MIEEVTEDGIRICRDDKPNFELETHYWSLNRQCFNGSLPTMPVYWAESITVPDGSRANAIYVPGDSVVKQRYIAMRNDLNGMFPLERLCLLHEMVHVAIGPDLGHGEEFIAEFRRVLDANKWEVMGCTDTPLQSLPKP